MKRFFKFIILVSCTVALVCCNKDENKEVDVTGDWKLDSINGVPASELAADEIGGLDVYVSFSADNTFEIFQRLIGGNSYYNYSGTYTRINLNTLSGTYSDGNSWGAEYTVELNDGLLTMTGGGDVCVYSSTTIPEEVKSSSIEVKSVRLEQSPIPFL